MTGIEIAAIILLITTAIVFGMIYGMRLYANRIIRKDNAKLDNDISKLESDTKLQLDKFKLAEEEALGKRAKFQHLEESFNEKSTYKPPSNANTKNFFQNQSKPAVIRPSLPVSTPNSTPTKQTEPLGTVAWILQTLYGFIKLEEINTKKFYSKLNDIKSMTKEMDDIIERVEIADTQLLEDYQSLSNRIKFFGQPQNQQINSTNQNQAQTLKKK